MQPTGGGKTVLASAIIALAREKSDARILFFAHRLELVDQAVAQLERWGTRAGVIRASDHRTNRDLPVQVATIQTLTRRDPPPADIVFVDEAHRAASDSYRKIMNLYPEALIIGLTATPCRLDGKPLGDVFEELVVSSTYEDLISDGFIVKPVVYSTRQTVDLSDVHVKMGDFREDELEQVMMAPKVLGSVIDEWQQHSEKRRTVVFACTIAHAKLLLERFVDAGARAAHVDGTTPEDERREILGRLERGELEVVTNVGVLTEGWDQPAVKCLSIARPTQSLSLWMQMAGRVLRPFEDVTPVIIDHGNNVDRHGLPHEDHAWSLDSRPMHAKERSIYHVCKGCYAYVQKNPCELCGFVPEVESREILEDISVSLEQREASDERRRFFEMQLKSARIMGFKPGFASAKFKERFGLWPPWSWSQRAKTEFQRDVRWQSRLQWRQDKHQAPVTDEPGSVRMTPDGVEIIV